VSQIVGGCPTKLQDFQKIVQKTPQPTSTSGVRKLNWRLALRLLESQMRLVAGNE
jgi:hypothetical protein